MEGVNGKDALTARTRTSTRDLPPPRSTNERVVNAVCVPRAGVITTPESRCFIIHLSAQVRGRARGWWRANPDVSESATEVTPSGRQVTGGGGPGGAVAEDERDRESAPCADAFEPSYAFRSAFAVLL